MDAAEDVLPSTEPASANEAGQTWEIAEQWRLAWGTLKWSVAGLILVAGLLAAGQVFLFHQMFSAINPALGLAFIAVVAALFVWLIGLPLKRFFFAPVIARPPDVDLADAAVSPADIRRRIAYDASYLKGMAANPALGDKQVDAARAREDLLAIKKAGGEGLAARLATFEQERIAILLVDLDKQVDEYIHKEALMVGSATAISMNGAVDAFVVLWRNVNMVARVSRLYYGRPSLRLSVMIMRDVMVAVLLSRALDDVTDAAGEALGGVVSKIGGRVLGPMMDGSVNALMTMKLGYVAKRRCRSFDVWSRASARRVTMEVFEQVKKESSSLIAELVKISGGVLDVAGNVVGAATDVASGAAGKVLAAPKSAWSLVQNTFVRKRDPKPSDG